MRFTIQEYKSGLLPLHKLIEFLCGIDREITPSISSRTTIKEYIQKIINNGIILVAMHGDSLLGLCGFYCNDHTSKTAFLTIIAVSPFCRGKGIASSLLTEAIAYSQARGMHTMRLETSPDNVTAQSLYKKNGFYEYKCQSAINGTVRHVYLERKLS